MFPAIFDSLRSKEVILSQCRDPIGWRWRFICRGFMASLSADNYRILSSLRALLQPFSPSNSPDSVNWHWTSNQLFTVKSTYTFLIDAGQETRRMPSSGDWKPQLKLKCLFGYFFAKEFLRPIDCLLEVSGWIKTVFCALNMESCDNLLCNCIFVTFSYAQTVRKSSQSSPTSAFFG